MRSVSECTWFWTTKSLDKGPSCSLDVDAERGSVSEPIIATWSWSGFWSNILYMQPRATANVTKWKQQNAMVRISMVFMKTSMEEKGQGHWSITNCRAACKTFKYTIWDFYLMVFQWKMLLQACSWGSCLIKSKKWWCGTLTSAEIPHKEDILQRHVWHVRKNI